MTSVGRRSGGSRADSVRNPSVLAINDCVGVALRSSRSLGEGSCVKRGAQKIGKKQKAQFPVKKPVCGRAAASWAPGPTATWSWWGFTRQPAGVASDSDVTTTVDSPCPEEVTDYSPRTTMETQHVIEVHLIKCGEDLGKSRLHK